MPYTLFKLSPRSKSKSTSTAGEGAPVRQLLDINSPKRDKTSNSKNAFSTSRRIQSLDLARGFTVLIMPSIHVVMLYSTPPVQLSFLGDVLAFVAEIPGAQLFMLLMGVGFVFSSRISAGYVLQRTLWLWVAAYGLNVFKFWVPLGLGWLPASLLDELSLTTPGSAAVFFLGIGDILHFAAIAYPVLYLVTRWKGYPYWSLLLAALVLVGSPWIWDQATGIGLVDYGLQLLGGHPPQTFFPVFPWLVYPLIGLSIGYFLRRMETAQLMKRLGWTGGLLVIVSCMFPATTEITEWLPFYRTRPADTLFHLGAVLVWIALIHWLSERTRGNVFFDLLVFCSKRITSIYIIQWVLICWGMGLVGYGRLGFGATLLCMVVVTAVTLLLAKLVKLHYGK